MFMFAFRPLSNLSYLSLIVTLQSSVELVEEVSGLPRHHPHQAVPAPGQLGVLCERQTQVPLSLSLSLSRSGGSPPVELTLFYEGWAATPLSGLNWCHQVLMSLPALVMHCD